MRDESVRAMSGNRQEKAEDAAVGGRWGELFDV